MQRKGALQVGKAEKFLSQLTLEVRTWDKKFNDAGQAK
jgi:hypothetical protein